ncbi:MAG TPA: gamma-glutamylcyclotransferase [Hyphomicrobiaceae bacterium]|nr:gamma-glutamylcyclotransferase [Hyphomicrobiaceae bacterium]
MHDLWVFAYGSLMWRPGFPYEQARRARLTGYSRRFCIYSVHHRGTPERLGLVLGLDRGGVCEGVAYRIAAANVAGTRRYLRARELVNGVYREAVVPIELEPAVGSDPSPPSLPENDKVRGEGSDHGEVTALAYIAERAHPTYAGRLPLSLQARLIRGGKGVSGANLDYLMSTVRHLNALGIRERELERLVTIAGPLAWTRSRAQHTSPYAAALARVLQRRPPPVRLPRGTERGQFLFRQRIGT